MHLGPAVADQDVVVENHRPNVVAVVVALAGAATIRSFGVDGAFGVAAAGGVDETRVVVDAVPW